MDHSRFYEMNEGAERGPEEGTMAAWGIHHRRLEDVAMDEENFLSVCPG